MTDNVAFGLQVVLGVVTGGSWVATVTLAAERVGGRMGGFISGFPSTTVVALLFIGWTQGDERLIEVTSLLPATFAAYALFLFVYWRVTRTPASTRTPLVSALGAWLSSQTALFATGIRSFLIALAVWFPVAALALLLKIRSSEIPRRVEVEPLSTSQVLWRVYIGGGVVGASVLMSKLAGPFMGAVFASAPASAISILYVFERLYGIEYARTLVPTMMVSGLINVVMFASLVWFLVPLCGSIGAIFVSLALTIVVAGITYNCTTFYH